MSNVKESEKNINLIPEAEDFVEKAKRIGDDYIPSDSIYGHLAGNLAGGLHLRAQLGQSQEEQRKFLRRQIKKLVDEYGPKIVNFFSDELNLIVKEEGLPSDED